MGYVTQDRPWPTLIVVTEYTKGSTPEGEMQALREAFARATAAIYAWPNPAEAWQFATELSDLVGKQLRGEGADFRAYLATYLMDYHGLTREALATFMGVTPARASQIIARARKKGNPVTDPATLPEQPPVVLAVVTSDRGVLVANRVDKVPPVTFPGGDMEPGESPADTAVRRVAAETGLEFAPTEWQFISRRIHPKTSRHMIYLRATADITTDLHPGDPEDLEDVRWATVAEVNEAMPDMFQPVRDYLNEMARV